MQCIDLRLGGPRLLVPERFADSRGYFCETYNQARLSTLGIDIVFVQDNLSVSSRPGTVRGLHFQRPPFAQAKLVRVARGRILDAIVDVRRGSPWYGRWMSVELSADDGRQLLVPIGFLHGFATLEPDTEVAYKTSARYSRAHDGAILWNDPDLAIDWPVTTDAAHLSDRDAAAPRFRTFATPFLYLD